MTTEDRDRIIDPGHGTGPIERPTPDDLTPDTVEDDQVPEPETDEPEKETEEAPSDGNTEA